MCMYNGSKYLPFAAIVIYSQDFETLSLLDEGMMKLSAFISLSMADFKSVSELRVFLINNFINLYPKEIGTRT